MSNRVLKTVALLALSGACAVAFADDAPALAGRVALAQGQVSISGSAGEPGTAQVNWPVTAGEMVTTARGARTELQIGSAFIRLDGDSSLEVLDLDEDNLRLRLHYGSASIRFMDRAMLDGFELSTPEGRVRMQEPGRLRVDAERVADTSSVTVFDGVALVDNGGANLTVRAGKRADLQYDDVRTVAATRDAFDDWALARDSAAQAPTAARYVSTDMTGYSDLDRYGSWRTDPEYGALWTPAVVSPNWVPYSDGSWVWFEPWGWTWVDNAPWGYAPFHYGRWVFVNRRWCWAPGRREHRPVWAPALVGWVGGAGSHRGWYPLSPRERFVPTYRLSDERLRRLNGNVRPDFDHHRDEHRHAGLTVVPQDQFGHRGVVAVPRFRTAVPARMLDAAPAGAPPAAPAIAHRTDERIGRAARWRDGERSRQQPATVLTAPSVAPGTQPARPAMTEHRPPPQPATVLTAPPVAPAQQQPQIQWRMEHHQREERAAREAVPGPVAAGPAPQAAAQQAERFERARREQAEFERRREMAQPAPAPVHTVPPPPAPLHVPSPGAAPVHMPPPPVASQPAPQPMARPAPAAPAPAPAPAPAHPHVQRGGENEHQHER